MQHGNTFGDIVGDSNRSAAKRDAAIHARNRRQLDKLGIPIEEGGVRLDEGQVLELGRFLNRVFTIYDESDRPQQQAILKQYDLWQEYEARKVSAFVSQYRGYYTLHYGHEETGRDYYGIERTVWRVDHNLHLYADSLHAFCKVNKLDATALFNVLTGKELEYHGYRSLVKQGSMSMSYTPPRFLNADELVEAHTPPKVVPWTPMNTNQKPVPTIVFDIQAEQ